MVCINLQRWGANEFETSKIFQIYLNWWLSAHFFRHGEDVDERKRPWKGNRQKFPPPWAQDVDHRHQKEGGATGPHGTSEDRDFRHHPKGREDDFRSREYSNDSRLEYTEDQDYRSTERGQPPRHKKRRDLSPEHSPHKISRHHDRDRHHHHHHHRREEEEEEEEEEERGKKKGEQGAQQKKDLPKPVPPPGVGASSAGGSSTPTDGKTAEQTEATLTPLPPVP